MSFTESQIEELSKKVDDLFADAPLRIRTVLKCNVSNSNMRQTYYLGQLLAHTEYDFLNRIPGSSKVTAGYVAEKLRSEGYALGALSAFKMELVDLAVAQHSDDAFKETLRGLPVMDDMDFSVLPEGASAPAATSATDWLRRQISQDVSGLSHSFLASVMVDPRVKAQIQALKDVALDVVREKLDHSGGPA